MSVEVALRVAVLLVFVGYAAGGVWSIDGGCGRRGSYGLGVGPKLNWQSRECVTWHMGLVSSLVDPALAWPAVCIRDGGDGVERTWSHWSDDGLYLVDANSDQINDANKVY